MCDLRELIYNHIPMDCDQKRRLLGRYNLALRVWAAFEDALEANNETASALEYQTMKISVDESRMEVELVRLELKSHEKQHQCGNGPD
jgi:hypothetical protein